MEGLYILFKSLLARQDIGKCLAVNIFRLKILWNFAAKILLRKHNGAVHKVTEYSNQLRVVTLLEILPGKVVILGLRSICAQHITQHILLAGEILQVLIQPYSPVAGSRDLLTLKIQELVGRHIVRKNISVSVSL